VKHIKTISIPHVLFDFSDLHTQNHPSIALNKHFELHFDRSMFAFNSLLKRFQDR